SARSARGARGTRRAPRATARVESTPPPVDETHERVDRRDDVRPLAARGHDPQSAGARERDPRPVRRVRRLIRLVLEYRRRQPPSGTAVRRHRPDAEPVGEDNPPPIWRPVRPPSAAELPKPRPVHPDRPDRLLA